MEVFDVLLQILDDGRLTDGQGRTVDFRNTVIIMTSNLRSAESMREFFRPEFLNRIDEVVEFHPLSREQLGEIVELQLRRLRDRLAERGLGLELSDAAKELVARRLGPDLRRAAAQAGAPAPRREPARAPAAGGEFGEGTRCMWTQRTESSSSRSRKPSSRPPRERRVPAVWPSQQSCDTCS